MTEDQQKKLMAFLGARLRPSMPCALCQQPGPWSVSGRILELREFSAGSLTVGGAVYPVLAITCETCGNTLMVNAIAAGILPKPGEPGGAS